MCLVENKGKTWLVGASRFQLYYSGITVLLGDRFNPSNVHRIRIGDILKLGSVSMLVTRLDAGGGDEGKESMDLSMQDWIYNSFGKSLNRENDWTDTSMSESFIRRNSSVEFELGGAADEERETNNEESGPISSEGPICYVCTDTEDTPENPLVSPCECKGGTKFVHINCLRKWVIKGREEKVCVVQRLGGDNPHRCSVCKANYKQCDKGVKIFNREVEAPSIEFVVLLSSNQETLDRGTTYSVSFKPLMDAPSGIRPLALGRNANCDVR